MADTPLLEYATLPRKWRRFRLGLLEGLGAAVISNIVPYAFTYHAWEMDGFEQIGFPLTFREEGGMDYRYMFSVRALLMDVIFCLGVGLAAGIIESLWKRRSRPVLH